MYRQFHIRSFLSFLTLYKEHLIKLTWNREENSDRQLVTRSINFLLGCVIVPISLSFFSILREVS